MQPTISLLGKRASARIFCSNLVMQEDKIILLLSAYGPSQEVRAFSQLLCDKDAPHMGTSECDTNRYVAIGGPIRLISKMDNGYSGLYVLPDPKKRLIVGDSREECFRIYSRILDQQQFVHRDWYQPLFDMAEEVIPEIGNKKIYRHIENVPEEVRNRIKYGGFAFPDPTASLTVEVQQEAATQP